MKKIPILITSGLIATLIIAGAVIILLNNNKPASKTGSNITVNGPCTSADVPLSGYGDPGHRLANCFVEFPGEPSRQDNNYYVVEDICGQFTQDFISNLTGKTFIRLEPPTHSSLYNCEYIISDNGQPNGKEYLILVLDYLKIDIQKQGQEAMGRTMTAEVNIPMRNFVAYQGDGQINTIYLVFDDNKFLSIHRSSTTVFTNEEILTFAGKLANEIKNYK